MSKRKADGAPRVLSCQRCRVRKIKCNLQHPCSNCVKNGAECILVTSDKRSNRPPANYVTELQSKISQLQYFIERMKKASSEEREWLLAEMDPSSLINESKKDNDPCTNNLHSSNKSVIDINNGTSTNIPLDNNAKSSVLKDPGATEYRDKTQLSKDYQASQSTAVYGPTSVYNDKDLVTPTTRTSKSNNESISALNSDPDIIHCLKLFFTWLYPDVFMFIFRESFLIDFFNPKPNSLHCSKTLVLAICAIGARLSDYEHIYQKSHSYYIEARSLLLSRLDHPSITNLQSFLLLSFYDICNGNNSSGWMLSGCAIRMGFDIGFQLDPESWFIQSSSSNLKPLDVAIRSRIYWGCYMADHFISLLLGRPSLLKLSDASIQETDYLPDLEWIEEFMYQDPINKNKSREEMKNISSPLRNVVKLINISDRMLMDIFTRTNEDDENEDINIQSRLRMLASYNTKIMQWRKDLPKDLSWDRDQLRADGENPVLQCIRCYYYILLLCLNRPFVAVETTDTLSPWNICSEVIDDIHVSIARFKEIHGLRKASIFTVYCSILSISVILFSSSGKGISKERKNKLKFFLDVLKGCSKTWNLAEKSHKLIKIKLNSLDDNITASSSVNNAQKVKNDSSLADSSAPSIQATNKEFLTSNLELKEDDPQLLRTSTSQTSMSSAPSTGLDIQENLEFFGGPPVLMTSDLFNEDWESLFPDYIFSGNN